MCDYRTLLDGISQSTYAQAPSRSVAVIRKFRITESSSILLVHWFQFSDSFIYLFQKFLDTTVRQK